MSVSTPSGLLAKALLRLALLTALGVVPTSGTASAGQATQAGAQGAPVPVVRSEARRDLSPPLSSIVPAPYPPVGITNANPRRQFPKVLNSLNVPTVEEADPVLDRGPVSSRIPNPLVTFEGVNNVNGVLPPDTVGDIGPNHYVQMVNLSFAIYNRTGTLLFGPANTNTVWTGFGGACETTNNGDPIVLYDHLADRWLISQFALPSFPAGPYFECIAISQTADPTGAWHRYAFLAHDTKMNDYPHFGVWPDGYYMSVNQFTNGQSFSGAGVFAFERDRMLQGLSAQMIYFDLAAANPNFGGLLPADLDGPVPPVGTPNYFASADDSTFGFATDRINIWEFHVDWTTPANSTIGNAGQPNQFLDTALFDPNLCNFARSCIPQPGTAQGLDAISDRLMHRLQYRNFGTHTTLVTNHTVDAGGDRAGIRWYELRKSGGSWAIQQQATHAPDDGLHRWMGSAAMNANGDIALGYSVSGTGTFPSIRYAGRLSGDPAGTLAQGEATMTAGAGSQTHSAARWGDYSAMSVDPADNTSFWYTQEYYNATSSASWRTRVGKFKMLAPTTNLTINDVSVSEGNSGTKNATFTLSLSETSPDTVSVDYATANGTATAAAPGTTTVSNSSTITIVDNTIASPYPSAITAPGGLGNLQKVTATLTGFTHTFPADVDVLLVGPGGQSVILMSNVGGGTDASNLTFVFDDTGAAMTTGALTSGTYSPTNIGNFGVWPSPAPAPPYGATLSVFNGLDPAGTWNLFVVDAVGGDMGSFSGGWSLTFTVPGTGGDYVTKTGTAMIPAGASSGPVSIVINGDTTTEPNETFFVNLSNAAGANLTDNQGLGTILNDEVTAFTDPTLTAGVTVIKVIHLTELRTRVNNARIARGLLAFSFTDPSPAAGETLIKAAHILELRTALAAAYTAAGLTPPSYSGATPAAGVVVFATAIQQIRDAVVTLESAP